MSWPLYPAILSVPLSSPSSVLQPPFLRLFLLLSQSLSLSISLPLSFDFFSFLLISIRRAGLATARLIRSLAYWSSHSHEDTMFGDRREATRWGFIRMCARVCIFFHSSLYLRYDLVILCMFIRPLAFTRSPFCLARARARLHHSEDIPKNRTMTNDRIWSKSSVLCDLSLDKSHGRNIFRIIVRYIAPLLLRTAVATDVTLATHRESEHFNFMSREVILFSRSRSLFTGKLLFTATLFVLLQLVTPRRFFFAVVKESRCPLTKLLRRPFRPDTT